MRFDFDDEQAEIKETARQFLAARFNPEKVRELAESRQLRRRALRTEVAELGWPGIAIAEEHGGQGLGMVELVDPAARSFGLRVRAAARCSAAPAPGLAIEAAGSDAQSAEWLPRLASSGDGLAARSATSQIALLRPADGADGRW